jgi:hypothetical protein
MHEGLKRVTRDERETECCEWVFVGARGPESVGVRSPVSQNRRFDRRVINEGSQAGFRQTYGGHQLQATTQKRFHRFLKQPEGSK